MQSSHSCEHNGLGLFQQVCPCASVPNFCSQASHLVSFSSHFPGFSVDPDFRPSLLRGKVENHMPRSTFCHQDDFLLLLSFRVILSGVLKPQQSPFLAGTCTLYRAMRKAVLHFFLPNHLGRTSRNSVAGMDTLGVRTTCLLPLQGCLGQVLHGPFPLENCGHRGQKTSSP